MNIPNKIPLSAKECKQIVERLKLLDEATAGSYDYPVEHLIDYMEKSRRQEEHFRDFDQQSGRTIAYVIFFSSPDETWNMLCGRAGYYSLHPVTLECLAFQLTVLS